MSPDPPNLVGYVEEDSFVLCEPNNPRAWIRSTLTVDREDVDDCRRTVSK